MNLSQVIPFRCYSFRYSGEVKMNVAKKATGEKEQNPFIGRVTVLKVLAGQASTMGKYIEECKRINPDYVPSDRTPTMRATGNPCIFENIATGKSQVLIMKPRTIKTVYFVDGKEALENQVKDFFQWITPRKPGTKPTVKVKFPYIENLLNVVDDINDNDNDNDNE